MQSIALSWLVYRLTNSPFLLGLVSFLGQVPNFFFAPFAGVLADRWNRRRILIVTQTLAMIQAFVLAVLVLTHTIAVWQIISLALTLGLINSVDTPTRQSFMVNMIEDGADLPNAIALNSSMVNSARLVGPSIAGLLIAAVGEGACFLINGLSYLGVIAAIAAMRIPRQQSSRNHGSVLAGLKEGISYAFTTPPIRTILIMLAFISFVGINYASLMPIFARDILHGNSRTLGFLMGATGVGALSSAVYMASRKNVIGLGKVLASASGILGAALICVSFSHLFWLSLIFMFFVGLGMMLQVATSNTLVQTIVDDDKRGRVVSLYVVAFVGMVPWGNLTAGTVASAIGAPHTLLLNGSMCIIASLIFFMILPRWRKQVRPIYIEKGILERRDLPVTVETKLGLPD